MSKEYEKLLRCYEYYKTVTDFKPRIALVLGSGLGNYAKNMKVEYEIPYSEIPGFPTSTVEGHDGRFLLGYIGSIPVVAMKGRVHYYEGYDIKDVVLPIRLMHMMGAEILFLTNACGGIQNGMKAGDFMLIKDHISSFIPSPLIGENVSELGERFVDMSQVYDLELQDLIRETAKDEGISLKEGVYLQATGPNYETPAEIRMYAVLGADAVGMSTVCEAIAARHAGMRVCGISFVSNLAAGLNNGTLSHEEVQQMAQEKAPQFEQLVTSIIVKL